MTDRVGNPPGMKHLLAVTPYLKGLGFIVNLVPAGLVAVHEDGTTITASNKRTKVEVRQTNPEGFEVTRCDLPPSIAWLDSVLIRTHP